jgi:hypothetical protein
MKRIAMRDRHSQISLRSTRAARYRWRHFTPVTKNAIGDVQASRKPCPAFHLKCLEHLKGDLAMRYIFIDEAGTSAKEPVSVRESGLLD